MIDGEAFRIADEICLRIEEEDMVMRRFGLRLVRLVPGASPVGKASVPRATLLPGVHGLHLARRKE